MIHSSFPKSIVCSPDHFFLASCPPLPTYTQILALHSLQSCGKERGLTRVVSLRRLGPMSDRPIGQREEDNHKKKLELKRGSQEGSRGRLEKENYFRNVLLKFELLQHSC